jgi:hypothetical protein
VIEQDAQSAATLAQRRRRGSARNFLSGLMKQCANGRFNLVSFHPC